jgi:hypothetical protein
LNILINFDQNIWNQLLKFFFRLVTTVQNKEIKIDVVIQLLAIILQGDIAIMSKICIWCKRDDSRADFNSKAHTFPQSIGGRYICSNVCDECNHYFGSPNDNIPSIETVFKETFNISRARLLGDKEIGKNKTLSHFTSIYFKVDFKKRKIDLKPSFKLKPGFQNILCRQFKRGLFKIFLEETERQNKNGLDSKFDFIRDFARYNNGDLPVLYFPRLNGMVLLSEDEVKHPQFYFYNRMKFHIKDFNFFEFEILSHLFSIPIDLSYNDTIDDYLKESFELKKRVFYKPLNIKFLTEIDLILNIFNDNKQ